MLLQVKKRALREAVPVMAKALVASTTSRTCLRWCKQVFHRMDKSPSTSSGTCQSQKAAVFNQEADRSCPVCNYCLHIWDQAGHGGISKRVRWNSIWVAYWTCQDWAASFTELYLYKALLFPYYPWGLLGALLRYMIIIIEVLWRGYLCVLCHGRLMCFKRFLLCSLPSGNNCCLTSLQGVPVYNSSFMARVMFN